MQAGRQWGDEEQGHDDRQPDAEDDVLLVPNNGEDTVGDPGEGVADEPDQLADEEVHPCRSSVWLEEPSWGDRGKHSPGITVLAVLLDKAGVDEALEDGQEAEDDDWEDEPGGGGEVDAVNVEDDAEDHGGQGGDDGGDEEPGEGGGHVGDGAVGGGQVSGQPPALLVGDVGDREDDNTEQCGHHTDNC